MAFQKHSNLLIVVLFLFMFQQSIDGQVKQATDGPKPLSPSQSLKSFQVAKGFLLSLVASEPLIQAPSGVCWDALGRMYVSELHGYNLEGQYDIEQLNESGELDRVVRRIQANDEAKKKAEGGTYGVIKILKDKNNDGIMDESIVFADGLPPCYGMVPAREGIIVAAAPHIFYLADTTGDGVADIRETLFSGFSEGVLERRINDPQWGIDNWIYFGSGGTANNITGPYLDTSKSLGGNDFRIRSDGSAIEPVAGHTGTFGHSFTSAGDRITIGTGTPGYQVAPIHWSYLERNPEASIPSLQRNAASYQETYPISKPHPWRTRRYEDPGFSKFYTDRYGKAESYPNGYFTSACSPFIYRDTAFPERYWGANFTCEPAQNLIHLSFVQWDGSDMKLSRGGSQPNSKDIKQWISSIHPTNPLPLPKTEPWYELGPIDGPDKSTLFDDDLGFEQISNPQLVIQGNSWVLKEQYQDDSLIDLGLPENSASYLKRTIHCEVPRSIYLSLGSNDAIKCWVNNHLVVANNVNRSLSAHQESVSVQLKKGANSIVLKIVNGTNASGFYFNMLNSVIPSEVQEIVKIRMEDWTKVQYQIVESYVASIHAEKSKKEFLASTDTWFHPINLSHGPDGSIYITDYYREIIEDYSAIPRYLQQEYGLIHGKHHGRIWKLSHGNKEPLEKIHFSALDVHQLTREVGSPRVWNRETARRLLIEKKQTQSLSILIDLLDSDSDAALNALYALHGLNKISSRIISTALSHPSPTVRRHTLIIGDQYLQEKNIRKVIDLWLSNSDNYVDQPRLLIQMALSLGFSQNKDSISKLAFLASKYSRLRWMDVAILSSVRGREDDLLAEILKVNHESLTFCESILKTIVARNDKTQILNALNVIDSLNDLKDQEKLLAIFSSSNVLDQLPKPFELPTSKSTAIKTIKELEAQFPDYLEALNQPIVLERGIKLFKQNCSVCHVSHNMGGNAGPNLTSEFQRAPETILRDILFPHESITEGFETYKLVTHQGAEIIGLLASQSPTSVTMRFPGGVELTFLNSKIKELTKSPESLMPSQFASILKPDDVAQIIHFLRARRIP